MANSKKFVVKNGLHTQNIEFVSEDGTETITLTLLDDGTLSFSGSSGQLFSITDSLTGSIFSVNDISGMPSIEVFDDGKVVLAETTGNVGIGTSTPSEKLDVNGNIIVSGDDRYMTFGTPGAGTTTGARFFSIEGNTDTSGEGSGRIFFTEHNSSTSGMDNYGMSLGYRGGATSIEGASGNTWTGLSQIANGEWGMWGHNNSAAGALIMSGDRVASFINFHNNELRNATLASPALTGTPTAPTAAANTNSTQIATTAYVQQEITDLIGGAPGALDTLNELAAAINDDASYAATITTALAGKVAKAGDTMTGNLKFTDTSSLGISNVTGDAHIRVNDTYGNVHIQSKDAQGVYVDTDSFHIRERGNTSNTVFYTDLDNVGIGITSPQTKLHITGPNANASAATLRIGGPADGVGNNISRLELVESTTNSNADMSYGFSFTADGNSTNNFLLRSHNNSTTGVVGLSQSRETGNVGIKTSGPSSSYALDVNGDVRGNRYYDRNDTNYYVDPASTSILNVVDASLIKAGTDDIEIRSGTISVGGDADTYYPVTWYSNVNNQAFFTKIQIYRNYNEAAPNTWNTSTHKGGLLLDLQTNWGGWGGVAYDIKVNEFSETYSTMVAKIGHFANSRGFAIWLRGGTATYHFYTEGVKVDPTVQLSAYDPGGNSSGVSSVTSLSQSTITDKLYYRGGALYDTGNRVLTTASTIDADTLDSIDSGSFLRSDANDTYTGTLTLGTNTAIRLPNSGANGIETSDGYRVINSQDSVLRIGDTGKHSTVRLHGQGSDDFKVYYNSTDYEIWHAGNDGSGSGLDADLLDGQHGSYYLNYNNFTNTPTIPTVGNGTQTITAGSNLSGGGSFTANQTGNSSVTLNVTTGWWDAIPRVGSDGVMEVGKYIDFHQSSSDTSDYSPRLTATNSSNLAINGNTIWHAGNDGSGSGLDADLLDTYHQTSFLRISANSSSPTNGHFAIGNASSRNFIQSHNSHPLDINPLGNNVILNSGGGNVGIGTTNPLQKLQVNGDITVDRNATGRGATITLANGSEVAGNYSALMFGNVNAHNSYRKGAIAYRTDGAGYGRGDIYFLQRTDANSGNADLTHHAMVIKNNGNVGIGTTSPSSLLHLSSGTSGDAVLTIEADTDNNNEADSPQIHFKQDGGNTFNKVGIIGNANDVFTGSLSNYSYIGGNNGLHLIANNVPQMTINTSGNVGIGTTSPGYKLDVVGQIRGQSIFVDDYLYHTGDTNTYIRMVGADDMQLVAGGRQMLRMDEGTDPDRLRFVTDSDWTDSSGNWNMSGSLTIAGNTAWHGGNLSFSLSGTTLTITTT